MAVVRITLTAQLYGSICQNVWHVHKPDFVSSELPVLITAWRDRWMDAYRNLVVAEASFLNLKGEVLAAGGAGDITNLPLNMVGGSGNDVRSPLMQALVVQLRTGLAGRKNRGRFYVFGSSVGQTQSGVFTGTWLAAAEVQLAVLRPRWVGPTHTEPWQLVIHGKTDGPDVFRVVTTMQARATPGCQRRRMLGVGI